MNKFKQILLHNLRNKTRSTSITCANYRLIQTPAGFGHAETSTNYMLPCEQCRREASRDRKSPQNSQFHLQHARFRPTRRAPCDSIIQINSYQLVSSSQRLRYLEISVCTEEIHMSNDRISCTRLPASEKEPAWLRVGRVE